MNPGGHPRRATYLLVFCLATALSSHVAAAQREQDSRAFLDVVVNAVGRGDSLVVLRDGDVLVAVDVLTAAGVQRIEGHREMLDAIQYVSLRSLAPDVSFTVDATELRLTITAGPAVLATSAVRFQPGEPDGLVFRSDRSGFVNYAINAGANGTYDVFTETAISARGAVFYNTLTTNNRAAVRGLTSVTVDQRVAMRRWTVGDAFAGGAALGGDAVVSGLTVSREFSIAPYFVQHPTLTMSTPVTTPSVMEVYVNGRMVTQQEVQPGRLDLTQLPLAAGRNDTRVTVRDAFGTTRELAAGYYMSGSVLAAGVNDYQYSVGWRREELGSRSAAFGGPLLLARQRRGLTNWLTLGGRAEAERRLISGGPSVQLRLPIGEAEASVAMSRAGHRSGTAAQTSYMYASRHVGGGLTYRRTQSSYETVTRQTTPKPHDEFSVFVTTPAAPRTTATVQHTASGGEGSSRRTSLATSTSVGGNAQMFTSVAYQHDGRARGLDASVGVTVMFGNRTGITGAISRRPDGNSGTVDIQRSLPAGNGIGFQVRGDTGTHDDVSGALQLQGDYGRYEIRRDALLGGGESTRVHASGGLAAIGGHVFATRAIQSSFALVEVPGVENVRTYSSNQEIGRTARGGHLLVPNLLPYYGNTLQIADSDIPLDYVVPSVQYLIAPPYRGGAIVRFPVQRVQRVVGTVATDSAHPAGDISFGEIAVAVGTTRITSPVGRDGEFYFENLPAGRYHATVTRGDVSCTLDLTVGASDAALVDLGPVTCPAAAEPPK